MIHIQVDEEVFQFLKTRAEPFVDTPNSVLRRELGLAEIERGGEPAENGESATLGSHDGAQGRGAKRKRAKQRIRGTRAPAGSLLPETEYVEPILRVIADKDGRAPTREVIEGVGAMVRDRLTALDKEKLSNGAIRWQNRIQFTRLRMVDQGLLKRGSPRGVWEITEEGVRHISSETTG
jgi:hypothetical protein